LKELYGSVGQAGLAILSKAYTADSTEYKKLEKLITGLVPIAKHFIAGSNDLNFEELLSTPVDLPNINLGTREREQKERNQWLVMTHGDAWTNNILFKYSDDKPTAVKFIDLQVVREMCLTTDLTFFFCMSTTGEIRRKYVNTLLETYFETFTNICNLLQVEPWSDFNLENLKQKYGKAMVYGGAFGLCVLPITLLPSNTECDLEKDSTQDQLYGSAFEDTLKENAIMEKRILEIAEEVIEAGVFEQ